MPRVYCPDNDRGRRAIPGRKPGRAEPSRVDSRRVRLQRDAQVKRQQKFKGPSAVPWFSGERGEPRVLSAQGEETRAARERTGPRVERQHSCYPRRMIGSDTNSVRLQPFTGDRSRRDKWRTCAAVSGRAALAQALKSPHKIGRAESSSAHDLSLL